MKEIKIIEDQVRCLWEGKGCEIKELSSAVNGILETIQCYVPLLENQGITFPMEFVRNAIKHLSQAMETKDDYVLADCLFFEWREIATVLNELIEELE